jgi:hypothetical protein
MTAKRNLRVANFEARSVALIASWTLAGAALAQSTPVPGPDRDERMSGAPMHKPASPAADLGAALSRGLTIREESHAGVRHRD